MTEITTKVTLLSNFKGGKAAKPSTGKDTRHKLRSFVLIVQRMLILYLQKKRVVFLFMSSLWEKNNISKGFHLGKAVNKT